MIKEGAKAPDFKLEGSDGKSHKLADFRGRTLVLYFYPKDDTPGCTIEAKEFTKCSADIEKAGGSVVGVSKDDIKSHGKFCGKYGINFLLLSDPTLDTIKAYESYGDRGIFGMGTLRKTYIIDKDGAIIKIYDKVKPAGHGAEVLSFIKGMAQR
jgi:peroxiredoxin Q/BCP